MSDERSLIRRCKQREEAAFADLVALKREKVFRIALNIVGDVDDAKDIAQLAFVRLWQSIGSFKEKNRFDPWFFRIVVNLSLDHFRRRKREAAVVAPEAPERPSALPGPMGSIQEAELYRSQIRAVFNEAAKRLSPQQRAAFTLRDIEGLSTEDTARALGVRPATVRNHVMQARKTLRAYLLDHYPEIARGRG